MANNPRTTTDLERKYNFYSLLGLNKNIRLNEKSIIQMQNELEYVRNKKVFSPKGPIVVIKKITACIKSKLKNPYITFS